MQAGWFRVAQELQDPFKSVLGPPARCPLLFLGRVPLLKKTTEKKGALFLTSLLEDLGESIVEPATTSPVVRPSKHRNARKIGYDPIETSSQS